MKYYSMFLQAHSRVVLPLFRHTGKSALCALLAVTLAAGLFAGGCIFDSDDEGGDGGGGGSTGPPAGNAAAFFPLVENAEWRYYANDSVDNTTESYPYRTAVTGTRTIGGYTWYDYEQGEETLPLRLEGDVIHVYIEDETALKPASPAAKTAAPAMPLENEELPWFDFTVGKGETWPITGDTYEEDGETVHFTMTGTYLGTETVSTPLGSFSSCAKFQITRRQTAVSNGTTMFEYEEKRTFWFAENRGIVKHVWYETYNGSSLGSGTDVLLYYSIPGIGSGGDPQAGTDTREFIVSGMALDDNGSTLPGVRVALRNGTGATVVDTTGITGVFVFPEVNNGTYTVTPLDEEYTWSPADTTITVASADMYNIIFTGEPDSPVSSDNGLGEGTVAGSYFPLAPGWRWSYDYDYFWGEYTTSATTTANMFGSTVIDGERWYIMGNDDMEWLLNLRIEDNILYEADWYRDEADPADVTAKPIPGHARAPRELPFAAKLAASDLVEFIRFDLSAGGTWVMEEGTLTYTDSSGEIPITETWVITGTYLGTESVTVPAGTFDNCRKYSLEEQGSYSWTIEGETKSSEYNQVTIMWLAENMGIVKSHDTFTDTSGTTIRIEQLREYTRPE